MHVVEMGFPPGQIVCANADATTPDVSHGFAFRFLVQKGFLLLAALANATMGGKEQTRSDTIWTLFPNKVSLSPPPSLSGSLAPCSNRGSQTFFALHLLRGESEGPLAEVQSLLHPPPGKH